MILKTFQGNDNDGRRGNKFTAIPQELTVIWVYPGNFPFPQNVPREQKREIPRQFVGSWKIGEFPAKSREPVPREYAMNFLAKQFKYKLYNAKVLVKIFLLSL